MPHPGTANQNPPNKWISGENKPKKMRNESMYLKHADKAIPLAAHSKSTSHCISQKLHARWTKNGSTTKTHAQRRASERTASRYIPTRQLTSSGYCSCQNLAVRNPEDSKMRYCNIAILIFSIPFRVSKTNLFFFSPCTRRGDCLGVKICR